MKKFLKFFVAFSIFLISAWKLKSELASINFKDVYNVIQNRSFTSIAILVGVSLLGIWILSLYDLVLVRSQKLKVPLLKTIKMSWIINSLNTLIGFGGIIGSTIRYNYFQNFTSNNKEKNELKKSISLLLLSMITGIGVLSILVVSNVFSASYLLDQKPILKIGLFILAALLPIFLIITIVKPPVASDRWLSLKYTCVSVLDYLFVGIVMFLALRFVDVHVSFWEMESVFIIATIAGLISMVPGGLGAFDVIFLLGMTHQFDIKEGPVLLALVFYRLAYYILPFFFGLILSVSELQLLVKNKLSTENNFFIFTKEFGTIVVDITKKRVQTLMRWFILVIFSIGSLYFLQDAIFGLFYIATEESNRFLLFFSVLYTVISVYMLPNYMGVYYGSKEAYKNLFFMLGIILLCQIVLFSTILFVESFVFTFIFGVVLYLSRNTFNNHLTIRYRREKFIWLFTLMFLFFILDSTYYTAEYFKLNLFRELIIYPLIFSAIWFIYLYVNRYRLRHKYTFSCLVEEENMSDNPDDFKEIIETFEGNNLANLGFLPSNQVLVDKELSTAAIFKENSYYILMLGDPVGNKENFFPFIKKIHDYATSIGKELIFYQTTTENIHIYTEFNYTLFNLGEEGELDVTTFKTSGNKGKVFRQLLNKQEQEELSFQIESSTPELLKEIKPVSDEWLGIRKEMTFSLGNFDEDYLLKQDIATLRDKNNRVIAFASMMPAYVDGKISVDLIRWKEHPSIQMMDLLYLDLILWAKENGYTIFNLGMAPLSSTFEKSNGLLGTVTTSIYHNSSSLYSFKGLRNYKNKYKPNWQPRYLVYPRRLLVSQALLQSYRTIHPK
ncbi:phosphatidylglycerol lysyltransferase domain-containing protein [Vagococcus carniphilus]|uniref:phosphatidylglycerol lysyltransferase domain-containing protein n=1 Tax=Vagococcus carniphilus TaxID=218144 RepID=UPI00288F361E|nr:phosphatidylglycerol lysyltransferase domain-containing protein [Vagococcus carniphilus]MDT2866069.1 phosphatidylglycerol lysyltransferase domain-containing protein [Vagococcus carniphilus]